jgi:ferredoxin
MVGGDELKLHELCVEPVGLRLQVPAGLPLLTSARGAGVELPSSCRNGTCRICMCRLLSGEVTYRIE